MRKKWLVVLLAMLTVLAFPVGAFAADGPTNIQLQAGLNTAFTFLAFILVFFMQAGFALLEAGSTRMKNAGHVAGKTILTTGVAALSFWALGFGFGFGNDGGNGFMGLTGFFMSGTDAAVSFDALSGLDVPITIMFLFHFAFAAVSLSIACGGWQSVQN